MQDEFVTLTNKAERLAEEGNFLEAISIYNFIIDKDPHKYDALVSLGNIYFHMNDHLSSAVFYAKALIACEPQREIIMSLCYMLQELDLGDLSQKLMDAYLESDQIKIVDFCKEFLRKNQRGC